MAGSAAFVRGAEARRLAPGVQGRVTLGWLQPLFEGLFAAPG